MSNVSGWGKCLTHFCLSAFTSGPGIWNILKKGLLNEDMNDGWMNVEVLKKEVICK